MSFIIFFFILNLFFPLIFSKLNFVDKPNERKIHLKPIPYSGGLVILLSILFSIKTFDLNEYLLISFLLIFLLGIYDDISHIKPKIRLVLQLLISLLFIYSGYIVTDLSLIDLTSKNLLMILITSIFTSFCILVTINAYNFIDGLDGLLCGLFISFLLALILFSDFQLLDDKFLIHLVAITLIFFFFNIINSPFKSFLGDGGSYLLGLIASYLMIHFTNVDKLINPILILWSCPIIFFDFCYIIFKRFFNRLNPTKPDNEHLHHILLKIFNHQISLGVILIINLLLILMGYVLSKIFPNYLLLIFLLFYGMYILFRYKLNKIIIN